MSRLPRFNLPGITQHIIQRGVGGKEIFVSDHDRIYFLQCLADVSIDCNCQVHAYSLMNNHFHLLMTPGKGDSVSRTLQSLGRRYVPYFNHNTHRAGTLWQGRYRAALVDDQYVLECYRYIEQNPVRSGMVCFPEEYPWTSYHANARSKNDIVIKPHITYLALAEIEQQRCNTYRKMMLEKIDPSRLNEISDATNSGRIIGSNEFYELVEKKLQLNIRRMIRGGDRRSSEYKTSVMHN